MNGTLAIIGCNEADLELLKEQGLTDEQAKETVVVCNMMGFSVASLIPLLIPAINQATLAIESVPDLGAIYARIDAPSLSRDERRLRSMRKPTGKPWDRRRR